MRALLHQKSYSERLYPRCLTPGLFEIALRANPMSTNTEFSGQERPFGSNWLQVCCRVLREFSSSIDRDSTEDDETPSWQLVGVLLPPFLHGLCMCTNRPRIAEGLLPPLVSTFVCQSWVIVATNLCCLCVSCALPLRQREPGSILRPGAYHTCTRKLSVLGFICYDSCLPAGLPV